jgi:hypothetical protein
MRAAIVAVGVLSAVPAAAADDEVIDEVVTTARYIASTPLRFALTASNVADKRHVTSCYLAPGTHWCWFGAERTVEATVQARF